MDIFLVFFSFFLIILTAVSFFLFLQKKQALEQTSKDLEASKQELLVKNEQIGLLQEKRNLAERFEQINYRLQKIDELSNNVGNLQNILGAKQTRGFYGERKLYDILQDELPANQFARQFALTNNCRVDAVIFLPSEPKLLTIDAKFPLDSFRRLFNYSEQNPPLNNYALAKQTNQINEQAQKDFVRDMKKHISTINEKYIVAGQTQDIALLFIPAESIFNYIGESCPELQSFASEKNVVLCSPNSLMLILHIVKSLIRDQKMQEHARTIQQNLLQIQKDVSKLAKLNEKLQNHFRLGSQDIEEIDKLSKKITSNIHKVDKIDLGKAQTNPTLKDSIAPNYTISNITDGIEFNGQTEHNSLEAQTFINPPVSQN